jgi:hypothetical protein
MTIATVINYCTNDYRFLARAIAEVSPFSIWVLRSSIFCFSMQTES